MLPRVLVSAGLTAVALTASALYFVAGPVSASPTAVKAGLSYVLAERDDPKPAAQIIRSMQKYVSTQALEPMALIDTTQTLQYLYVSPQGDDSGAGTKDLPFRTIKKAAAVAIPGTTVRVAPGTYQGSVKTTKSGTAESRIAYVSETKWGAKVQGDGGGAAWGNEGNYVDIVGFDIAGKATDGLSDAGSFVRMAQNNVHGFSGGNCLNTASDDYQLHDIDVIANVTHGCGAGSLDHGIYVSHPRGTVANNMSYDNSGYGIHCWHNCNKLTITNNLVFNNDAGGMVIGQGDGPNNGSVKADGFLVANNIAANNGAAGIKESGATGSGNKYVNNNVFGNRGGGINLATGKESGTLQADPQFVDFKADGSGDYRLRPTSPNINAGSPSGAPGIDILGTRRPKGGGIDIGIYQH